MITVLIIIGLTLFGIFSISSLYFYYKILKTTNKILDNQTIDYFDELPFNLEVKPIVENKFFDDAS
jgi:hypothetical protein